jgi:hypothetical protein
MNPDFPTLTACIDTLAALGEGSSFAVLFSAMSAGYSEEITQNTIRALESLKGDYKQYLVDVIVKNTPAEKLAAYRLGADNQNFTEAEQGDLAETALMVSLDLSKGPQAQNADVKTLRYEAVKNLTRLHWTRASDQAVRNFYLVQTDFSNNAVNKERLIEAIACLGAMGDSESAQVLAIQLGFYNSQVERSGEYDADIILALVNALGEIGDKVAFDYLLYIGYLSYPETIQNAAREALQRLKW